MLSPLASAERRDNKGGGHKKNERESGKKKGHKREKGNPDGQTCVLQQTKNRQTDNTKDTQNQVAEVKGQTR